MRKNFKPYTKQNKIANSFRKKTIDPGVDLNLKKDDDNLENIDDYWNMAEYIIDDSNITQVDNNVPKEAQDLIKKDKQKNKKFVVESLESSVINEVMDISTDGSKTTGEYNQPNKNPVPSDNDSEDTLFDINNIRESLSHNAVNKMSNVSNTSGFENNHQEEGTNEILETNTSGVMQKNKQDKKIKKNKKEKVNINKENKSDEEKIKSLEKKLKYEKKKIEDKKKDEKKTLKEKSIDKLKKNRKSSDVEIENYKGELLMGKNNKIYGMTKISSFFQGKSKLEPLITKKCLESGILFLNPGASILQETADNPFTIFLLKGTIEITLNNEFYKLDRDSCMFIDEGSAYNIIDKSRSGSSIFVTFKAK